MKKLFALLVVLTLFCSTALADEILFRGIPWGCTPTDFVLTLEKEGTWFDDINDWTPSSDFVEIEASPFDTPKWSVKEVPIYELNRYDGENKSVCVVAGYDVERVTACFMPVYSDGTMNTHDMANAQLYEVRYRIADFPSGKTVDSSYDDLVVRLTELYGEGADASGEVYERACHWLGDNGTTVSLYRGSSVFALGIYIPAVLIIEYRCAVDTSYVEGIIDAYNNAMNTDGGL